MTGLTKGLVIVLLISVSALLFVNRQKMRTILKRKKKQEPLKSMTYEDIKQKSEDDGMRYDEYILTKEDVIKYGLIGYGVLFGASYLFYSSLVFSVAVGLIGSIAPKVMKKQLLLKQQSRLALEFKDALYSIHTSLAAGESPPNALKLVAADLEDLYVGQETFIIPEFDIIRRKLELNYSVAEVLTDFAERTGVNDIENFADIFITSMDTGGKQSTIIKNAINTIMGKIEIKRDIEIMISAKKYETRVMMLMPVAVILFLRLTASDYLQPVYETLLGRAVMTIVLVGMAVAAFISAKIMRIEV